MNTSWKPLLDQPTSALTPEGVDHIATRELPTIPTPEDLPDHVATRELPTIPTSEDLPDRQKLAFQTMRIDTRTKALAELAEKESKINQDLLVIIKDLKEVILDIKTKDSTIPIYCNTVVALIDAIEGGINATPLLERLRQPTVPMIRSLITPQYAKTSQERDRLQQILIKVEECIDKFVILHLQKRREKK